MTDPAWTDLLALGPAQRTSRLEFLQIEEQDRSALAQLAQVLAPHLDSLVEQWHGFLLERPETRGRLPRGKVGDHLRAMQARYFRTLLSGPYDRDYFEDRLRIGFVHERVGLEPAWYLGSYRKFQDMVRDVLLREGHEAPRLAGWLRALEKVVYLDVELALDAYFHTRNRTILDANAALNRMAHELERRNAELSAQFAQAQEAARLKDEFLSVVSHEVRTPLHAILGFADLLADGIEGPVNPGQVSSLAKIRRHGERLLGIFDQMLEAARLAAAGSSAPRAFDLQPVLERAAEAARPLARDKGLLLEVALENGLPAVVGDPEGFGRALEHVLENACKYTARGTVRLASTRVAGGVRVEVSDTGPGVPEAHRHRIFEPFHQVESGDTRTATGVGLGLALGRRALERMGGTLTLAASGPRGSTFVLELPEAPPPGPEETAGADADTPP
ncbi:MAG: protoglobin domain-containing protein [Thermodesulfobacteriota bacterium]